MPNELKAGDKLLSIRGPRESNQGKERIACFGISPLPITSLNMKKHLVGIDFAGPKGTSDKISL